MTDLDSGRELSRLVLHYFKDQGGFIGYEDWKEFDNEMAGELDPFLQSQWIAEGYIHDNSEKGGYELTASGKEQLKRLTALRFGDHQDQSE